MLRKKMQKLIFLLLNRFPDISTQWMFRQELEKWSKKTVHFCLVCNACFTTTMYVVARKWIEFKYPLQKSLLGLKWDLNSNLNKKFNRNRFPTLLESCLFEHIGTVGICFQYFLQIILIPLFKSGGQITLYSILI